MKKLYAISSLLFLLFITITTFTPSMSQPIKRDVFPRYKSEHRTLSVSPNPTVGEVSIECDWLEGKESYVAVLDISGKTVLERYVKKFPEDGKMSIDLSQFSAGIYIIRIHASQASVTAKVVRI